MYRSVRAQLLLFAIITLASARLTAAQTKGPEWSSDFNKASSRALELNKPLLLDFFADWCASCKKMEKDVYSDQKLMEAAAEKFILVRINSDKEQSLARKYNVAALPYIVFANSYGTELLHYRGFIDASSLANIIEAMPSDVSEINRFDSILKKDKNNFEALKGMGHVLRAAGLFTQSNEYYAPALKKDPAKNDPAAREIILLEMGNNYLALMQSGEAIKIFEKAVKEYPASNNSDAFRLGLAQSYLIANKKRKAKQLLQVLAQNPDATKSQAARSLLESL